MWPFKTSKPKQVRVEIRVLGRDISKLTLSDWRSDEKLVSGAGAALSGDFVKLMMEVLRNEHPAFQVMHPQYSLEARALQQARAEGYTLCLSNLEAMGRKAANVVQLEPTFEPEEQQNTGTET